ncbi:MAG: hypothetical protein AAF650_03075 [Pseudomonadota bacterium]
MYSEDDINSAVAAGAISAEAAANFRDHISRARALPRQSEENFRLINSFNDIFVAIGIVILLVALAAIGQAIGSAILPYPQWADLSQLSGTQYTEARAAYDAQSNASIGLQGALAGLLIAGAAWPLAEFFTRQRRMALPSILLLLAFVASVFATAFGAGAALGLTSSPAIGSAIVTLSGVLGGAAAYIHWRRFQVPITVAAAAGVVVLSLLIAMIGIFQIDPGLPIFMALLLVAGLVVFAFAMRWDISDRGRTTRRSDVAFWLHLLAAPLIAHPIFSLVGVTDGANLGLAGAIAVLAIYIAFGLLALAIDRRALLVSALAYVLFALTFLFREFGAVELGFALTALVIGSALLSLSAFWQTIRLSVVGVLPQSVRAKLPEATVVAPLAPATAQA